MALTYAVEPEPLDTAGAVKFAADFAGIDDTFVVVNGDVLTDLDLSALIAFHRQRGAEGTIALHPVPDPSAFGVVPTDDDGRVTAFVEKPTREEAPTNQINAGTYVLEPSMLDRIPTGRRVSIERETFPATVKDRTLFALADDAYWLDTGTPAALLQATRDLVEGRRHQTPTPGAHQTPDGWWAVGEPFVSGSVVGASVVMEGCVVAAGARIEGSVLGRGCVVDAGATVTDAVLLDGARVAAGSTVAGSILGPGAIVGERCEIRPISVVGDGAMVPSGSVVDGERFPG